jgi:Xaa-Pro aminopeptidase
MSIITRVTLLRDLMLKNGIDAVLVYGTDPHLSEYVPESWRSREWISGFTGSYGKVAITKEMAVLWTDSRYFIQAESQLSGSGIMMIKDRQADTISVDSWLTHHLKPGSTVAIDGYTISATEARVLEHKLGAKGITLVINRDLLSPIWEDRPPMSPAPIIDYPVRFAGQSRAEKLSEIRNRLTESGTIATLICQLDDLAWSFNLRGNDISYNPLFTGYGYIDQQNAILFIEEDKIENELIDILNREGVAVINYKSIFSELKEMQSLPFYLDPDRTNSLLYRFISQRCQVINGLAIPTLLKSVKNEVELAGMREAHRRDGAAMVNFLYWFDQNVDKIHITELLIAEKLRAFRSEQLYYSGESFCSTVAFGSHGAIVHYSSNNETDCEILPDGILLIDSGGQYLDGTTDITRTIATGKVTETQKTDFTMVLKGMIQLAKAIFPENTKGYSLDVLARKDLWSKGLNYGHGTGHGVGHYLSVHEGPMSVRPDLNAEPIRAGQIITDEPGVYREGEYGIRIENVLMCQKECQTDFGSFLSFDTITLCPVDRKMVNRQFLTNDEIEWLNVYHARVLDELRPALTPECCEWLINQCAPL